MLLMTSGVSGCAIRCPYNVIKMVSTKSEHGFNLFELLGSLLRNKQETDTDENGSENMVNKRKRFAIKCDNCMGYPNTACTNNCPTHAIKWVSPVEYFGEIEDIIPKRKKYQ